MWEDQQIQGQSVVNLDPDMKAEKQWQIINPNRSTTCSEIYYIFVSCISRFSIAC